MKPKEIESQELTHEDIIRVGRFVEAWYEVNMRSLTRFGLYKPELGDAVAPTIHQVREKLLQRLWKSQLNDVAGRQNPALLLEPVADRSRYLGALGIEKPATAWISKTLERDDIADPKVRGSPVSGWRWAITEGAETVAEPRDNVFTLDLRINNFIRESFAKGTKGMSMKQYALFLLQSTLGGRQPDRDTWTVCNGSSMQGGRVAGAGTSNPMIFLEREAQLQNMGARFRPTLCGEF
ncbi:hypothetical protein HY463_01195 [Candidatus Peregrinibacteria bacterium]|nr:hypothetical protein [Candidatus Peregrinibacteria bacterium]